MEASPSRAETDKLHTSAERHLDRTSAAQYAAHHGRNPPIQFPKNGVRHQRPGRQHDDLQPLRRRGPGPARRERRVYGCPRDAYVLPPVVPFSPLLHTYRPMTRIHLDGLMSERLTSAKKQYRTTNPTTPASSACAPSPTPSTSKCASPSVPW